MPQVPSTAEPLRIATVRGAHDFHRFIRVSWSIYAKDPVWGPPLWVERRDHLSQRNPYFAHARTCFWLAYRGVNPVGRMSAQVDELWESRYRDATGFFTMLEAEDAAETFHALLGTAEVWLRDQGMSHIRGPFNFSSNQECGLLVEGCDKPPMIMMGHARPYYPDRILAEGSKGVKDLSAYRLATDFTSPEFLEISSRCLQR